MFGFMGKKAKWDPSLERFPEINIDAMAKELSLEKRGKDDGALDQPPSDAQLLTAIEQSAVESVGKLRREALTNYELELQALRLRVSSAKSDTSEISLKIGDAMAALERLKRQEELQLEPARVGVVAYRTKVERFIATHDAVAPPKPMQSSLFTFAFMAFMLAIESSMNGLFFAEQNEMGLVGGVTQAFVISLINVLSGFGAGFFQRYYNLRGVFFKLISFATVISWLVFVVLFNLAVAHFRSALEGNLVWEDALRESISLTLSQPFELGSLSSWMLFIIGAIVSFASFLKGAWIGDPIPGFNAIWNQSEIALNRYADAFDTAHSVLDDRLMEEREALQSEVERRRADLRSATDALLSRKTMFSGLEVFLDTADSAANMLLKRYREANQKARKSDAPRYFQNEHRFERPQFADLEEVGLAKEIVEAEIRRMERLVEVGVAHLMRAQKRSLIAFPTIEEIRSGKTEKKNIDGGDPLAELSAAIEDIVNSDGYLKPEPKNEDSQTADKVSSEGEGNEPAKKPKRSRQSSKAKAGPNDELAGKVDT
ncbi:MAG: hypothetical protein KGZ72_11950 [Roseovarius sp.]|nr:hypothetical protein [Roseovarius sp.]